MPSRTWFSPVDVISDHGSSYEWIALLNWASSHYHCGDTMSVGRGHYLRCGRPSECHGCEKPVGLRWRIALLEKLLDEKQWDKNRLSNVVRGYVPAVFQYHRDSRPSPDRLKWFPSFQGEHMMRDASFKWVKEEIEIIGREFSEVSRLNNRIVRHVLEKQGWGTGRDLYVIGCPDDKRIAWRYDGIKYRVGLEVELSSRPAIFKQCFKFLVGQGLSQIDLGVIMVRRRSIGSGPTFDSVEHDITRVLDALPMFATVIFGF